MIDLLLAVYFQEALEISKFPSVLRAFGELIVVGTGSLVIAESVTTKVHSGSSKANLDFFGPILSVRRANLQHLRGDVPFDGPGALLLQVGTRRFCGSVLNIILPCVIEEGFGFVNVVALMP